MREWLKLMLEEIRRREDDERRARQEASEPASEAALRKSASGQDAPAKPRRDKPGQ